MFSGKATRLSGSCPGVSGWLEGARGGPSEDVLPEHRFLALSLRRGEGAKKPASSGGGSCEDYRQLRRCFLTTAVCEYLGKADDCEELTTLRAYRDNWLAKQPGGRELIEEYYAIAPGIVHAMKESARYGEICEELLARYIRPCLALIAKGKNEECKQLYMEMVRYAEGLTRVAA